MKEWWERWGTLVGIAVVVGGGAWAIRSSIAGVREDLTGEIHALELRMETRLSSVEIRMASVEAKLDLLIEGLDIEVSPKMADLETGR
ncbi:MAG: hypothetical protein OXI76_09455, partial [Gemmatimonadota bacterium]|nr:hypothetical protein [Gemmatimonadota bacterium]